VTALFVRTDRAAKRAFSFDVSNNSLIPKTYVLGLNPMPGAKWRDRLGDILDSASCEHDLFDLEQPIMKRIRSKRQRAVGFETLEGRLALSAGMGTVAAAHHAEPAVAKATQSSIPASFRGHVQILSASELAVTGLTGTIGKNHFTGSGTGNVAGKQFEGGDVFLSNSQGSVELQLSPAFVVKVGRSSKQEVSMVAVAATGKFAAYVGITGTITTWNVPAKPSASASFSGSFKA
jgi:hypothetical protein